MTRSEPWERSGLFARLLSGKPALPYPPPLTFGQPWYEVVEQDGPFDVVMSGALPSWGVRHRGTVYLDYLVLNQCPWGVVEGNSAAADLCTHLARLRGCENRTAGDQVIASIEAALLARPEFVVAHEPWPTCVLRLDRAVRQGRRRDVEHASFFRHSFDGTNRKILNVVTPGSGAREQTDRLAALKMRDPATLSPYERQLLDRASPRNVTTSDNDWVRFECDIWRLFKTT